MIPSFELIGRVVVMLTEMRDSKDTTKLNTAINHLETAGHMLIDTIKKKDCINCPSYGRGLNTETGRGDGSRGGTSTAGNACSASLIQGATASGVKLSGCILGR